MHTWGDFASRFDRANSPDQGVKNSKRVRFGIYVPRAFQRYVKHLKTIRIAQDMALPSELDFNRLHRLQLMSGTVLRLQLAQQSSFLGAHLGHPKTPSESSWEGASTRMLIHLYGKGLDK